MLSWKWSPFQALAGSLSRHLPCPLFNHLKLALSCSTLMLWIDSDTETRGSIFLASVLVRKSFSWWTRLTLWTFHLRLGWYCDECLRRETWMIFPVIISFSILVLPLWQPLQKNVKHQLIILQYLHANYSGIKTYTRPFTVVFELVYE